MSIQVPKSSKYHKVKRIQEADFMQYFNQTLYKLDQLDTCGGEYYIDTEDYSEDYELQAFPSRTDLEFEGNTLLSLRALSGRFTT